MQFQQSFSISQMPSQNIQLSFCPLCQNPYGVSRAPLQFQCGHTFCSSCVSMGVHKYTVITVDGPLQFCKFNCPIQIHNSNGQINGHMINLKERINVGHCRRNSKCCLRKCAKIFALLVIIGLVFMAAGKCFGKPPHDNQYQGNDQDSYIYEANVGIQFPDSQTIQLTGANLTDRDMKTFSKSTHGKLMFLDFTDNHITENGMIDILNTDIPSVRNIILSNNSIGPHKFHRQTVSKTLPQLLSFYLDHNNIDDGVVKSLANLKCPNLIQFNINDNQVGHKGLQILADNNFFNHWNISLNHNNFGNEGMKVLASTNFHGVGYLDLSYNNISEIYGFSKNQFQYLSQLDFRGNPLTEQSKNLLVSRFGSLVWVDR